MTIFGKGRAKKDRCSGETEPLGDQFSGRGGRMAGHAQNVLLFTLSFLILAGMSVMEIRAANERAERWEKKVDTLTTSLMASTREKAEAEAAIASLKSELGRAEKEQKFSGVAFSRQECMSLLNTGTLHSRAVTKNSRVATASLPKVSPAYPAEGDPLEGFVDPDGQPVPSHESMVVTAGKKNTGGTVNMIEADDLPPFADGSDLLDEPAQSDDASSYADASDDQVLPDGMEFMEMTTYDEGQSAQFVGERQ